jgi:DNA polymerase III delta prime subunit
MFKVTNGWQDVHHAVLIEGGTQIKVSLLKEFESLGFSPLGNPDFSEIIVESFGVDDARKLSEWASLKPIREERKVTIIFANNLTLESQNSLLKTLEEPPLNTHIIFVVEKARALLPTLISRVMYYESDEDTDLKEAKKFLDGSVADRLATVKKLSKKEDKSIMKDLTRNIEKEILLRSRKQKIKASVLRMVIDGSQYSGIRGGSPKMILEWLATCL